jgi:signal transduction histidine kinase
MRIVQEAFSNIRKHANASEVHVDFSSDDDNLIVKIRDDGQGFLIKDVYEPSQHGLKTMQERAELIAAKIDLLSNPNMGTKIMLRIPSNTLETTK